MILTISAWCPARIAAGRPESTDQMIALASPYPTPRAVPSPLQSTQVGCAVSGETAQTTAPFKALMTRDVPFPVGNREQSGHRAAAGWVEAPERRRRRCCLPVSKTPDTCREPSSRTTASSLESLQKAIDPPWMRPWNLLSNRSPRQEVPDPDTSPRGERVRRARLGRQVAAVPAVDRETQGAARGPESTWVMLPVPVSRLSMSPELRPIRGAAGPRFSRPRPKPCPRPALPAPGRVPRGRRVPRRPSPRPANLLRAQSPAAWESSVRAWARLPGGVALPADAWARRALRSLRLGPPVPTSEPSPPDVPPPSVPGRLPVDRSSFCITLQQ